MLSLHRASRQVLHRNVQSAILLPTSVLNAHDVIVAEFHQRMGLVVEVRGIVDSVRTYVLDGTLNSERVVVH